MLQDIFVGVMCVIVAGVAVWGWWMENGPDRSEPGDKQEKDQNKKGRNREDQEEQDKKAGSSKKKKG